ncbi:hypothetical protein [Corynebacterium mayonis]|uniref:hypothetical protein n=1 Tax=Corynebacterium mayonis TaxID=3062461 RepID=UPI003140C7EA
MTSPVLDRALVEAARDAALSVPGVASLHAGRYGEVAVLLPGTRVMGLRRVSRAGEDGLEVHLVAQYKASRNMHDVADEVRTVVSEATGLPFVDVVVADAQ